MIKKELIKKSPLRILEQSIHGGIGKGNIAILAAPQGLGKTACLVHIATDQLLQGKHVIHVSFRSDAKHIVAWYEDIFSEIARRNSLSGVMEVHDEVIKNRVIMNFTQNDTHIDKIKKNIGLLLKNSNFCVDTLVIDGYNFTKASPEDFRDFRRLASENNLELWFSASLAENAKFDAQRGFPELLSPFIEDIAILITLEPNGKFVRLKLIKDHDAIIKSDLHLKLDPEILLIAEET
jgi:KaiC/GvpD/RAD55 family RecA-like ATPase